MARGWELLGGGVFSFVLSLALTRFMIWFAPRIGFTDQPGHRKIHSNPKPLGGGVAIFWSFALSIAVAMLLASAPAGRTSLELFSSLPVIRQAPPSTQVAAATPTPIQSTTRPRPLCNPLRINLMSRSTEASALIGGMHQQMPLLIGVLVATLAMHVMGLFDDRRALGPCSKLIVQLGVTAALVITMEHFAQHTPSLRLRILTTLDQHGFGPWPSIILTVFWIAGITNAFNFLDNMDGLSAGVAAVCTTAFLVTALSIGQWFVAGTLAIFLGSLLGFLVFNFAPARIFMGDSGSLVVGFILGVLTVRTTFLPPGESWAAGWYAVFAPVIVLAVPLYDLVVVSLIRMSRGDSPFKGDTNHFSHRLVARGMSRRTAVLCIYLVTAATSIAAILLPQVRSGFGAMLILLQTALVLGVVLLLEQHKPSEKSAAGSPSPDSPSPELLTTPPSEPNA
ncbi:MAG: putative undecaprenyl-phosphate N-acetylglucosaminyl 1-phosphate transferase [Phycisphaerales bacterium]|nr:putative undecaprenyl-phosphate N-acetylglucosaminyl 1-phosphate transferase [Phycisphaerales bacterium]